MNFTLESQYSNVKDAELSIKHIILLYDVSLMKLILNAPRIEYSELEKD
jgi:hypothetical protein